MKGVKEAIAEVIAAQGLSYSDVAKTLKIGRQTLSRKINGHVDFSLSEISAIADIAGTSAASLLERAAALAASSESEAEVSSPVVGGDAA